MCRSAARVQRNVPFSVTSSTRAHCSSVMSTTLAVPPRPALFIEHVDAPRRGDGGVEEPLHVGLDGHVAAHRERPLPDERLEPLGGLAEAPLVDVADHDARALLGAALRATAKPMPVPAAAVTTTVLPASRSVPGG